MTANPQRRVVIVDDEQIVTRRFTSIIEHLGVSVSVIRDSVKGAPETGPAEAELKEGTLS